MRRATILAVLAIAAPAAAEDPPPAPPDPELLEFLGELAGEDLGFVEFMAARAERRAARDAGAGEAEVPKEDEDE